MKRWTIVTFCPSSGLHGCLVSFPQREFRRSVILLLANVTADLIFKARKGMKWIEPRKEQRKSDLPQM
jgi:hypothetical protein